MSKKLWSSSVSLLLCLGLIGCGGSPESTSSNNSAGNSSQSSQSTESTQSTEKKYEGQEVIVVDWGGAFTEAHKKAMYEPFEEKFGAKVVAVSPPDYGKFKAMVDSGNVEWDVVSVDTDFSIRAGREGLLEKLNYNVISKDGIPADLIHDYGIGAELFTTVISYNTETFPEGQHPKTWAEFWNVEKYPGDRTLYKSPIWTLESALLADGVAPEDLYPLDVDRAFKSLDKIKKNVKVWWNAGAQPPQLLATGEVTLGAAWNGRITTAKAEGAPEDVEFNQGLVAANTWVVPKGAPNKELAMEFIAFSLEPEQQAAFSSIIDYAPANEKALASLPDDVKQRLGQTPEMLENLIYIDFNWWVDNYDAVNERFEKWLLE